MEHQTGRPRGRGGEGGSRASSSGHGRGLGLALVAQAARRNGGTVEVGRERGAVLTVRLPLDRPARDDAGERERVAVAP